MQDTPKALTGAYKYALRQAFLLETGDDPDRQPSHEQEAPAHDPEWDADRKGFHAKLSELMVDYEALALECGSRPSGWGRQGRRACIRDLLDGKLPRLYTPDPRGS